MKKIFCLFLSVIILCGTMPSALALDTKYRAKLLRTVGDGWSYYVEYEVNGKTYRSDQVGTKCNEIAWGLLDEEDKMAVARTYAFSPNERINQFGAGSAAITAWANEKQGWTEAAEILRQRIANKYYPELTDFFSNPSAINVGNTNLESLSMDSADLPNYSEINLIPEHTALAEKISALKAVYSAGQSCLTSLSRVKTSQVNTAVKSLSADLIKLITDKVLVPSIVMSPTSKLASSFADIFSLIDTQTQLVDSLYNKLIGQSINSASASQVINDLWVIILQTEKMANALKSKCEEMIAEIERDIEELKTKSDEVSSKIEQKNIQQRTETSTAINLEVVPSEYIFTSYAETEQERIEEIRSQAQAMYSEVMGDYNAWKSDIPSQKQAILDTIGINSLNEGWIFDIPSYVLSDSNSYLFDLTDDYFPEVLFESQDYLEIKAKISARVDEAKAYITTKINTFTQYDEDATAFFETQSNAFKNDIEPRLEGLKEYWEYVSLSDITQAEQEAYSLLNSVGALQFWRADYGFDSIKTVIENLEKKTELIDSNYAQFTSNAIEFEGNVAATYSEYSTIKANLENSAYAFIENYNNINTARNNFPYFVYGQTQATIMKYVKGLLDAFSGTDAKKAEGRRIANELSAFREQELSYIRKMNAAKAHTEYYRGELTAFLKKYFNGSTNNYGYVLGFSVEDAREIEERIGYAYLLSISSMTNYNKAITPTSALSDVISDVLCVGKYYEQLEMIAEELDNRRSDLLKLGSTEFATKIADYKSKVNNIYNLSYNSSYNNLTCIYTHQAVQYYKFGVEAKINAIETLEPSYVPVTGFSIINPNDMYGVFNLLGSGTSDFTVDVDETIVLNAQVEPSNATEQRIVWSSSNTKVATVDADGNVTGIGNGNAIITATALDDGSSVEKTIMVGNGVLPDYYWDNIAISNENSVVEIGAMLNTNLLEDSTASAIIAIYDGSKLIACKREIVQIYANLPHSIDFFKEIGENSSDNIRAKLMLWSETDNLAPLISVVSI